MDENRIVQRELAKALTEIENLKGQLAKPGPITEALKSQTAKKAPPSVDKQAEIENLKSQLAKPGPITEALKSQTAKAPPSVENYIKQTKTNLSLSNDSLFLNRDIREKITNLSSGLRNNIKSDSDALQISTNADKKAAIVNFYNNEETAQILPLLQEVQNQFKYKYDRNFTFTTPNAPNGKTDFIPNEDLNNELRKLKGKIEGELADERKEIDKGVHARSFDRIRHKKMADYTSEAMNIVARHLNYQFSIANELGIPIDEALPKKEDRFNQIPINPRYSRTPNASVQANSTVNNGPSTIATALRQKEQIPKGDSKVDRKENRGPRGP